MRNNYLKPFLFIMLMCSFQIVLGQTQSQKDKITSRYDKQKLQKLESDFTAKAVLEKQQALELASQHGWSILRANDDGSYDELVKVSSEGKPIYYSIHNVAAAKSTRANRLNTGGGLNLNIDGQNMTAHVWDGGGTRPSHQEFDGPGGNNRVTIIDGSTLNGNSFHAMHVTGTIVASGVQPNAKGMAWQAKARTSDWNNDLAEATTAAGSGMIISNHSYGFATRNPQGQVQLPQHYFGGYITESRSWDQLLFNAPNYLMVVAAGNDGNDNTANNNPTGGSGFDKLTGHSTSKNNLVVANAQDANIDNNGNLVSVSINSSSSEGPTDDFRIKPDITGNGTAVYSTYDNSDTAYNSITGTSMASPNVAGTLLLLQQHYNNVSGSFMKAATLKGLALHTADDAGASGPDAVFGWGLMNANVAAVAITQNGSESKIEELTLTSGQTYTITVDSDGVNPLLASISWTDRAGTANTIVNSTTPVLVNDLDIRVTKGGTTSFPYELTGALTNAKQDNNVDPYERVDISGASGTYTITVTHKGSLTGGSQNFSLVVTGLTGTPVVCTATVPTGLSIGAIGSSIATASWDAVSGTSYDFRYRQTGASSWTTSAVSGTSISLTGLTPETSYETQVRSKCPDNSTSAYSSSVNFTTTAVQLNYCASSGNTTYQTGISRVIFGTIDNADGPAKNVGYEDFTNLSTSVTQSSSENLTVYVNTDGNYRVDAFAWIDWNQNGVFTDSGEAYDLGNISNVPNGALPTLSISIPASAQTGSTRMRVSARYNANPTPCQTGFDGEVEDYTVNVGAGTPDTTVPVITLTGASTINLNVGDTYNELGATATDNIDGNLTSSIVISGTVNTNAAGTYTVNYNVSDAAGNAATQVSRTVIVTVPADTTAPVITLTGASTINLNVGDAYNELGATATDNIDGNLTSSIVISGTVNTNAAGTYTVNYNVSDAAGNAANQVSRTVIVTEPSSGCSGGISSFPYSESFESGLGAWTQSTADDINWTRDSGGTPSSNTGPSGGSPGSWYMYVEASGNGTGYPNKRAILNSPCFNLSAESAANFSFSYHMYGAADMGSIALEASKDNGTTWTSLWSQTGNKGNAWLNANINLAAYVGGSVQLRFNRVTGATWQADIAIDNAKLSAGGGNSGCSGGVSLPYAESYESSIGAWTQSTADDINWTRDSGGTPSSNTGPSGGSPGSWYMYVEASGNGTGYPNKRAILNSPCVDLTSGAATFNFSYHMYGAADMGSIALEASGDNGASWTSLWSQTGNKGNSWLTASIDLSAYAGGGVQLRFNRVTGATWRADIAIDNISITTNAPFNGIFAGDESTETEVLSEFRLHPNPVKGNVLNVEVLNARAVDYVIYNMIGQVVKKATFVNRIDVSLLESGVYMIQVNAEDKKFVERFIKE